MSARIPSSSLPRDRRSPVSVRALALTAIFCALGACQTTVEDDDDDDGTGGAGATSASSTTTAVTTTTGGGVSLPPGCWNGPATCDPRTNAGCGPDEACDAGLDENGTPAVACFPPPNTQGLGQACDPNQGPFCQGGTTCVNGTCAALCCSAADCGGGLPCTAIDPQLGTLGACVEPQMCSGPGGPCSENADCCSNDCHVNHCH